MKKTAAAMAVLAAASLPVVAFAQSTPTVAAPDFSDLTDYIIACIPIGVAALGIGVMAALAFHIVVKIGKKITSAS